MANYSGILQNTTYMNITNNIFVNTGNNEIIRRFTNNNNNVAKSIANNTYWYDGALSTDGGMQYDTNPITTDPNLTDPDNAIEANRDFTPRGVEQLRLRTGDPRWLPEVANDEK